MNTNAPLIFVYLGKKLPKYVKYSTLLACKTSHSEVVLLSEVALDIKNDNYKNILIQSFYDYSEFKKVAKSLNFDKDFWNGFWLKTLERFFVLRQYMKHFEINKCFHAEADNMVFNLSGLSQKLDIIGEFIFIPKPSQDRALASLIYINSIKPIEMLCSYAKEKSDATNEMQILAYFINKFPNYAKALPTDIAFDEDMDLECISPELSGGIFDGAAVGQWLFGIDMRHLNKPLYNHFKNHELGYKNIENLKFNYKKSTHRLKSHDQKKHYQVYNLHIHSKVMKNIENKFERILNRTSQGKRSLISLNLKNSIIHFLKMRSALNKMRRILASFYMNKYLKIVLQQYQSRGSWLSVISWIFLKVKKIFKLGYSIRSCNKDKKIDILIPTILKDFEILELFIESLCLINHKINKIYIVSPTNDDMVNFCEKNNIIHIDELDAVGFAKKNINYVVDGRDRSGWLYQQLIKLSCDNITELKDVLVIDSDTIFVNKNCFFSENKFLFYTSAEWHQPYFDTFKNIFGYAAPSRLSLTSHMMIFNHDKLKEMKKELEKKHNKSWQEVYLSTVSPTENSCISDYDTYANWMLCNYSNEVKIYPFYNKSDSMKNIVPLNELRKKHSNLKSVSFHSYIDDV